MKQMNHNKIRFTVYPLLFLLYLPINFNAEVPSIYVKILPDYTKRTKKVICMDNIYNKQIFVSVGACCAVDSWVFA